MSEFTTRRSMIGAPPSGSKEASSKLFFKANPPKRDKNKPNEDEEVDGDAESVKSNSLVNGENEIESAEVTNADKTLDYSTIAEPTTKRRRKKRRIRLTDHGPKSKKRADKRFEKKDAGDEESKENAESTSKKEKEIVEESLDKEPELSTYTPFQLLCDYILRKLILKDPEEFFAHPVSPLMAPDYLTIIKEPMDFMTIRYRIEQNEYKHINEFHSDVDLIWENAMTYNQPNTVYYLAAHKLSMLVKYYMSEQFLEYIRYSAPFGRKIQLENVGLTHLSTLNRQSPSKTKDLRKNKLILDDLNVLQIIESSDSVLRSRLTDRVPSCGVGYLDNREGALALNILIGPTMEKSRLTLADIVKPLESGNPGLLNLVEPKLCMDYPISYTDPGPYASFAPQFDSTWATLNKHDSELLFSCYGDQQNAADAMALRQMVADCNESYVNHVDSLLNSLTDGEHSRTMTALKNDKGEIPTAEKLSKNTLSQKALLNILENVQSLQNLGLDLSFVKDLKSDLGLVKKGQENQPTNKQMLRHTDAMLTDLAAMNYGRLSTQPMLTLTDFPPPTIAETQLANCVANQLNNEIKTMGVNPGDVVSQHAIHHSLGLNGDDDDDEDFDVLREFMAFETLK